MKEELYIITDESKVQLDLPSPSGITLKWVSNLFNDISKLTCSYSYTFKLPMTSRNRRALELADDIRHENSMMKKSYRAEFYINGICLCPNANLYINEMTDSFSCVMTWRILKGFELMKSDSCKLNELPTLGKIIWGGDEQYGGIDPSTSNMDDVVYPDYDAGVPHMTNTPPKPCVPVFRIIQMINEKYGVKLDIGKRIESGMGMKPKRYLNNANYYGHRVYDDFVSNGVIPLVNSEVNNDKYSIRGIYGISSHTMYYKYLDFVEKWKVAVIGTGSSNNPRYTKFYGVTEGTYTNIEQVNSEQLNATYVEPDEIAVGIPVFNALKGNDYIKPLYAFQHNTGLFFFNAKKSQKADVDWYISSGGKYLRWATRTYEGIEQIMDGLGTTPQKSWGNIYDVKCTEDTTGSFIYSYEQGVDAGRDIGIIGFFTRNAFTVKGSCDLRISKTAVTEGRVDVYKYMWMCLAAVSVTKKNDSKEYEFKVEPVTEKSINSSAGFQSVDTPKYEEATDSYICHFEFGSEYDIRKIEVDSNDDEDFVGYVFLPYYPEDHIIDVDITDEDGNTDTIQKLNLKDGDFIIENIVITELAPSVDVSVLPTSLRIIESLPTISCFDFMKSVFYMNGAMPRVERDGETITAMYYNQLRDRVNDGEVLDWSDKLLSADKELPKSSKLHSTKFARNNYFEMSKSSKGKTEEEVLNEFDQYSNGYGNIQIDDDILKDEMSVFKSSFYPAFVQNLRYPLIKVGNTCKIWEGDNVMESKVPAIYGYMVYRTLDHRFEDTSVRRPQNADITRLHKRMNIFSPFDDEEMMDEFFGYLKEILNDYQLVKEQIMLNEIDLRDFDESIPVYLRKYNAYFAVSSIQRDKNGVSTVEFVKLPRVYDKISDIDNSYSYEILSTGYIEVQNQYNSTGNIYFKRTKEGAWEELTNKTINYGEEGIYAIASEYEIDGKLTPSEMRVFCKYYGKYRFTYKDPDTGEEKNIVRSEALAYFDGKNWTDYEKNSLGNYVEYHTIKKDDLSWHYVEIVIPIRNQFNEIVDSQKWKSPILVSGRSAMDNYDENGNRVAVSVGNLGRLYVNLIRDYTSNQTAIVSSRGMGEYDGFCNVDIDEPLWAYPYEGTRLKGDSYTFRIYVYTSISYTVSRYRNGVLQSSNKLTAKLRTYYDDERIVENTEKTYLKSEFGQYHTIKYEGDLVDEHGAFLKKIRRRVIWFISEKIQSVIDSPYGTEHDDDKTVKVNDIKITGLDTIADGDVHEYKLSYSPDYADVKVASVRIHIDGTGTSNAMSAQNVSVDAFSLVVSTLPENEQIYNVTVVATLEDGSTVSKSTTISVVKPTIELLQNGYGGRNDFEAINGSGVSGNYRVVLRPQNQTPEISSVTSSNSSFKTEIISETTFRLSVVGITEDASTNILVTAKYGDSVVTGSFAVTAKFVNAYSASVLDEKGVLIVDRNGRFYTKDEWIASGNEGEDADGVAVSDGIHRLLISKTQYYTSKGAGYGTTISGIVTTTDESTAFADFAGKSNTDLMVASLTDSAASEVRSKALFVSGKKGYIGSLGEWAIIASKRGIINTLLGVIGAEELFYKSSSCDYMTSTHSSNYNLWYAHFGANVEYFSRSKNDSLWIRALAEIPETVAPVKEGYMTIGGEDSYKIPNGTGSVTIGIAYGPEDVTVSEVYMESSNPDVVLTKLSDNQFKLAVSGMLVDEITTISVKARLNGLIKKSSKTITFIGETVVDYEKLDSEHALILDKEYNLYTEDEWYDSKKLTGDVEGIAVSDGTHRIIMSAKSLPRYRWGGRSRDIEGLSTSSTLYNGYENTECIVEAVKSSDGYFTSSPYSAAAVAKNNPFPSGEEGFLGSVAEWELVAKYAELIESLISAVGGDDLIKDSSYTYWTSTGYSSNTTCRCYHMYRSSIDNALRTGSDFRARSETAYIRVFRNF